MWSEGKLAVVRGDADLDGVGRAVVHAAAPLLGVCIISVARLSRSSAGPRTSGTKANDPGARSELTPPVFSLAVLMFAGRPTPTTSPQGSLQAYSLAAAGVTSRELPGEPRVSPLARWINLAVTAPAARRRASTAAAEAALAFAVAAAAMSSLGAGDQALSRGEVSKFCSRRCNCCWNCEDVICKVCQGNPSPSDTEACMLGPRLAGLEEDARAPGTCAIDACRLGGETLRGTPRAGRVC